MWYVLRNLTQIYVIEHLIFYTEKQFPNENFLTQLYKHCT